jgi:hypothetical protein
MHEPAVRASDAEREQTVELLRRHAVDGRMTLEEFAERMSLAFDAKTRDELDELTRDLPALDVPAVPPARRKPTRWLVSVMGGTERRGRFRLGGQTTVLSLMGGADIDLRQAEITEPEPEMTIVSVMGGANVIVPEGVDVELTGLSFMGGRSYRPGKKPPPPSAPVIRVRAFSFMGGVSVTAKPPR